MTGPNRAKALEWYEATDHPQDSGGLVAHGIGGRYSIEQQADGSYLLWWANDEFTFAEAATLDDAKAQAEADWQRRYAERGISLADDRS